MHTNSSREQALEFLADIEARHNQVLDDLDQLNERVQHVLDQYLQRRQESRQQSAGDDSNRESATDGDRPSTSAPAPDEPAQRAA